MIFSNASVQRSWENHTHQWSTCTRCPIGGSCSNHVLGRGKLPAEVFFLGEAPGPVENAVGLPFQGPSGRVLDSLIREVRGNWRPFSYFIGNVLACYPDDGQGGFRPPTAVERENCAARLEQTLLLCRPKILICLGRSAETALNELQTSSAIADLGIPDKVLYIWHPSYILRNGGIGSLLFETWKYKVLSYLGDK